MTTLEIILIIISILIILITGWLLSGAVLIIINIANLGTNEKWIIPIKEYIIMYPFFKLLNMIIDIDNVLHKKDN